MTIYQVIHEYDVDGGFGDAIPKSDVITMFSTKEMAEDFVKKYAKPHIYAQPYDKLKCGDLEIREVKIDQDISEIDMWWNED